MKIIFPFIILQIQLLHALITQFNDENKIGNFLRLSQTILTLRWFRGIKTVEITLIFKTL